jgi:hypothetical protein
MNFWKWFFIGDIDKPQTDESIDQMNGKVAPGIRAYLDGWLVFHIVVGILLMLAVPVKINEAAKSILLPLAGIFIGLTFAWGGNAVSLMQSKEIDMLADFRLGGLKQYVFKFQAAILVLLITIISWGLAGLNVFEFLYKKLQPNIIYNTIEACLYFLTSIALRDCWHVVMGAQSMVLLRSAMKKVLKKQRTEKTRNKGIDSD